MVVLRYCKHPRCASLLISFGASVGIISYAGEMSLGNETLMESTMKELKAMKIVGKGAMGTVLMVRREGSDRPLALKATSKAAIARKGEDGFRRAQIERNILSRLDHPFLPTLFGHVETEKIMACLIDYCPGGDLNGLRRRQTEKTFSESIIRFYAAEIVLALEHLHSLGIVYRDLKPENVLIQGSGHVMLTDFDLSTCLDTPCKQFTDPQGRSSVQPRRVLGLGHMNSFVSYIKKSKSGSAQLSPAINPCATAPGRLNSFAGTDEYVSPEMVSGTGHEFAVDWWALGILLYEMLYGYTPFKGSTRKETFYNILVKKPQFAGPWTPLRDLILRLLEKEPEKRLGFCHGVHHIKSHAFFRGLDWDAIHSLSRPPFVPSLFSLDDMKAMEGVDIEECVENLDTKFAFRFNSHKHSSRSEEEDSTEDAPQNWVERLSRAKDGNAYGVF